MPRRKKNGQSPARVPDWEPVGESLAMASNLPLSKEGYDGEKTTQNMREMFSHLDPEVIYTVLAECDFKAESAIDALLELSIAAELEAPVLLPVSGFERTAAALLTPSHLSQPAPDAVSEQVTSPLSTSVLTEELDFQVEQELQNLTAQQEAGITLSLPQSQQVFPELLHFNQEHRCGRGSTGHLAQSGTSSPIDPLSTKAREFFMDFQYPRIDEPVDMSHTSLNLASAERPSAFQMYKKNGSSHINSENIGGRAQMTATSWNLNSPAFSPSFHGNQRPCFVTPAAPLIWPSQDWHPSPWRGQAPCRPSTNIPTSKAMVAAVQPPTRSSRLRLEGRVLVLIRGAPGSGKTTLAKALVEYNAGAVALSTDDYFTRQGRYLFDPSDLGQAHEWNHMRAKEAFERGANPIIIDNTNMQGWEMKPYVAQALKHNYKVLFREPDTWWKNKPRELQRRSKHNVPVETIRRMLNGYERFVSVKSIMGSFMPEWKQRLLEENRKTQCVTPDAKCPDLVSESGLMIKKRHPHFYSSLPDVSSIGHFCEVGKLEDDSCTGHSVENSEHLHTDDDLDLRELDSELDALNYPVGNERIPDCIVESVMNHGRDEIPVAFSESIKQRVPRPRKKCDFYETHSADLVKEINQSDVLAKEQEQNKLEEALAVGKEEGEKSRMLHFAGDWPTEGVLEQRHERRSRERDEAGDGSADTGVCKEVTKDTDKGKAGPNLTEFQKLLDLIQTGVVTCQSSSLCSSPLSVCHEQELDTVCKIEEALGYRSQSEERELNLNTAKTSKGDLPDFVLDWKVADPYTDEGKFFKSETTVSVRESDAASNSLWATAIAEKKIHDTEHDEDMKCKEQRDIKVTVPLDSSNSIGECQAPEGSCVLSGDTQEPRQRQGRRSGKQCKLALTFTQNCPASSLKTLECASTTVENADYGQSHLITHPDCASFNPKPDLDLFTKPKEDIHPQPSSPLYTDGGCPTQTEPQDFALLWRLNRQDNPPCSAAAACTFLCGDALRFVPELASAVSAAVAVHPSTQNPVPYHVVHDKGTQVEDREFEATQSRVESLSILSRHFKLVGFETLEDLYDKCQQDLEWTINLLLDSGEKLFRDEDVLEECGAQVKLQKTTTPLEKTFETRAGDELPSVEPNDIVHILQQSACEELSKLGGTSSTDLSSFGGTASPVRNTDQFDALSHTVKDNPSPTALENDDNEPKGTRAEWSVETADDIASLEEVNRLLLAELEREEQKKEVGSGVQERGSHVLNIQCVELKLPTELALQLTELFGPVGIEPGTCSPEDYAVQMDMNLAKLLHQKWKETIQERQRQETTSYRLLQNTPWSGPHPGNATAQLLYSDADSQAGLPFMDHWNFSQPHVSLRDIIKEELAMEKNMEKSRQSRANLSRRDGASMLKEEQLYSLFPTIDRHFLQEIFRDHNYCLSQTEIFLNSLLDQGPVKTVVAPELPKSNHHRPASKEKEQKLPDSSMPLQHYQDTEDPQYEDFRAEANLQRSRQLESFSKAAEAHRQGRKQVASFYALQGHLHGQRMREANHRAAIQIFERVNSSLLPNNILDLHGLHVNEALEHLQRVLQDKKTDCEQGLCRPQLSVITGRGNHSQGGVARIRPAVINYLTKAHYRFTEPKPGYVLVTLK